MESIPPLPSDLRPYSRTGWTKVALAGLIATIIAVAAYYGRDHLRLDNLVRHEETLQQFQRERPWLAVAIAFSAYVFVTGFSIPAATAMSLLYAWYFGFWRAVVLLSFSSTTGATVAFLISRFLLRDAVQRRFGGHLERFNAAWEREGAAYLLTLRLLPVVPFFVVNAVMGLTQIRVRTFWWGSQLGMLPGTLVYAYAGSTAPNLKTLAEQGVRGLPWLEIIVALTLLGMMPLVVRWTLARLWKQHELDVCQ